MQIDLCFCHPISVIIYNGLRHIWTKLEQTSLDIDHSYIQLTTYRSFFLHSL